MTALIDAIPPTRPTKRETLLFDGFGGRKAKVNHQVLCQVTSRLPVPLSVCCAFWQSRSVSQSGVDFADQAYAG